MTSVTVLCHDLARILGNALHFMPARNRVQHAALIIDQDGVVASGCRDGYVAGVDRADIQSFEGVTVVVMLTPEDMEALKKVAQAGKKFPATLKVEGGTVTLETTDDSASVAEATDEASARSRTLYSNLHVLMGDVEKRDSALPGTLMIDPALMSPFAKVKSDSTDRKADLLIKDDQSPILIKVGPTFRGLLQPIHRGVNAAKAGEDGLW